MPKTPWEYTGDSEHSQQVALFMWANMACNFGTVAASKPESYSRHGEAAKWALHHPSAMPQLKWLHAIKNQGHGDKVRGNHSAAEGVKRGVSDVFLPVPMAFADADSPLLIAGGRFTWDSVCNKQRVYCGLYIELKASKGKASDEQLAFQTDMRAAGYACEVCTGWEAARDTILRYLGKA